MPPNFPRRQKFRRRWRRRWPVRRTTLVWLRRRTCRRRDAWVAAAAGVACAVLPASNQNPTVAAVVAGDGCAVIGSGWCANGR